MLQSATINCYYSLLDKKGADGFKIQGAPHALLHKSLISPESHACCHMQYDCCHVNAVFTQPLSQIHTIVMTYRVPWRSAAFMLKHSCSSTHTAAFSIYLVWHQGHSHGTVAFTLSHTQAAAFTRQNLHSSNIPDAQRRSSLRLMGFWMR